jgi:hypothetical protein
MRDRIRAGREGNDAHAKSTNAAIRASSVESPNASNRAPTSNGDVGTAVEITLQI